MSSALQLPRERVLALDPATVEAYLAAHGWEMDRAVSSSEAAIYHLSSDPQAEIVVPRDKDFVDYALRIGEVVREVAVAERRKAWEVLDDLSRQQAGTSANGPTASERLGNRPRTAGQEKRFLMIESGCHRPRPARQYWTSSSGVKGEARKPAAVPCIRHVPQSRARQSKHSWNNRPLAQAIAGRTADQSAIADGAGSPGKLTGRPHGCATD